MRSIESMMEPATAMPNPLQLPAPRRSIAFSVHGDPKPQGSKRAGVSKHGRAFMYEQNAKPLNTWRNDVAVAALAARAGQDLLEGPLELNVAFRFPRPKGHFGKKGLRASAPDVHSSRPDIDNVLRALLDSLTGVLFADDAQVVEVFARKEYSDRDPGAIVEVSEWEPSSP